MKYLIAIVFALSMMCTITHQAEAKNNVDFNIYVNPGWAHYNHYRPYRPHYVRPYRPYRYRCFKRWITVWDPYIHRYVNIRQRVCR